jgi:hypothetical protein
MVNSKGSHIREGFPQGKSLRDFLYRILAHTQTGFSSRRRPWQFSPGSTPGQHTSTVLTGGGCWLFSCFANRFHHGING